MIRALLLVAALLLPACGDDPLEGPPTLRPGRDECVECGMLLAEDRCCAAALIEVDGVREHRLFDDLGCLIDWGNDRSEERILSQFARDYATREWVEVDEAVFLHDASILTPMASGLVAFRAGGEAAQAAAGPGGTLLRWPELAEVRAQWWAERRRPQ
jgi:copper chaperone NosL